MANASLLKLWGLLFGSTDQNDASVEKILQNLGLPTFGTAASRNVGIGANQIPDMSSFTASLAANGYAMLPNGYIIQQENTTASTSETDYRNFPIPFPNACFQIVACYGEFSSFGYGCAALPTSKSQFVVSARSSTGNLTNAPVRIIALGN